MGVAQAVGKYRLKARVGDRTNFAGIDLAGQGFRWRTVQRAPLDMAEAIVEVRRSLGRVRPGWAREFSLRLRRIVRIRPAPTLRTSVAHLSDHDRPGVLNRVPPPPGLLQRAARGHGDRPGLTQPRLASPSVGPLGRCLGPWRRSGLRRAALSRHALSAGRASLLRRLCAARAPERRRSGRRSGARAGTQTWRGLRARSESTLSTLGGESHRSRGLAVSPLRVCPPQHALPSAHVAPAFGQASSLNVRRNSGTELGELQLTPPEFRPKSGRFRPASNKPCSASHGTGRVGEVSCRFRASARFRSLVGRL